jgi:glucokinase
MTLNGGPVVGVDLGGTKILARMVDLADGSATGRVKNPTPSAEATTPADILDAVIGTVEALPDWQQARAIGIGVPGFVPAEEASAVQPDNGVAATALSGPGWVARCPNLAGWDHPVAVGEILSNKLGLPVFVGNDVNCGALAEFRFGTGPTTSAGSGDLLAVFVGTGVGGGLILDGELVTGPRGMAAEIGHLTVRPGGRRCGCGEDGHLEAYAGRAGIEAEVRRRVEAGATEYLWEQAGSGGIKSRHLARGLEAGDDTTVELVNDAAEALALALGNAASLLDLRRIVLGGGVVDKLGEPFVEQIVASDHFGGFGCEHVSLVLAQRLDDAGVLGAAVVAERGLARAIPVD